MERERLVVRAVSYDRLGLELCNGYLLYGSYRGCSSWSEDIVVRVLSDLVSGNYMLRKKVEEIYYNDRDLLELFEYLSIQEFRRKISRCMTCICRDCHNIIVNGYCIGCDIFRNKWIMEGELCIGRNMLLVSVGDYYWLYKGSLENLVESGNVGFIENSKHAIYIRSGCYKNTIKLECEVEVIFI